MAVVKLETSIFFVIMEACQVAAGHRPDHPTDMKYWEMICNNIYDNAITLKYVILDAP